MGKFFALYQITVVHGSRHVETCSLSPEMFVWLHLIVTLIELGARGHAVLVSTQIYVVQKIL